MKVMPTASIIKPRTGFVLKSNIGAEEGSKQYNSYIDCIIGHEYSAQKLVGHIVELQNHGRLFCFA